MIDLLIRLIADGLVILIVLLGGIGYLWKVKVDKWYHYSRAFMAGLSALVMAKLMSLLYVTAERPFVILGVDPKAAFLDNPGFPSDHALFVATITLIVAYATRSWRLVTVLACMSLLVGLGRVLALVHAPADVIGGFTAAALGVLPWYVWQKDKRKQYKTSYLQK